uniref:Alpha-carbonic anhydrase domain-containing protein n=1 Tax=Strigamia maritima TaxID=126957 RepID=T1JAV1_STRMM
MTFTLTDDDESVETESRLPHRPERGASGPSFWGLINPEWSLCNKGRRQSPINIDPNKLLFDPHLRFMHIDKHRLILLCAWSITLF